MNIIISLIKFFSNLLVVGGLCLGTFILGVMLAKQNPRIEIRREFIDPTLEQCRKTFFDQGYERVRSSSGARVICRSENNKEPVVVFYPEGNIHVRK